MTSGTDHPLLYGRTIVGDNVESLPCKLTHEEHRDASKRLARLISERVQLDDRAKAQSAEFLARKKELDAEIRQLGHTVDSETEVRDVKVLYEADVGKGEVYEVRTDTGEKVRTRALRNNERQEQLPGIEDAANRAAQAALFKDDSLPDDGPDDGKQQ
jgi:hypothetical protein